MTSPNAHEGTPTTAGQPVDPMILALREMLRREIWLLEQQIRAALAARKEAERRAR